MKISVIVPSYNQGPYLGECLRSISRQLSADDELFVIDGGSLDSSVEVIKEYDEFITSWVSERDRGQGHAVNKGLSWATGDLLVWVNSDDALMPGALERLRSCWSEDIDLVLFDAVWVNQDATRATLFPLPRRIELAQFYDGSQPINQPCSVFKRTFLGRVGLLREDLHYGLDYDLFVRAMKLSPRIAIVSFPFAINRVHSATKTNSGKLFAELEQVARMHFGAHACRYPAGLFSKYGLNFFRIFRWDYAARLLIKKMSAARTLPGGWQHGLARTVRGWLSAGVE